MPPDLRLGYLVFEARRLPRWEAFCQHMLGLAAPAANEDGSLGWQIDGACHRLIVQEGPADDPAGWETQHTDVTSAWGHKPKLRLQLKMAAGLIAQKVSGAPRQAKELA
jgi:hypothetical protein